MIKANNSIFQLKELASAVKVAHTTFEPAISASNKRKQAIPYGQFPMMLRLLNTIRTSIQEDKASKFYYFGLKKFMEQYT